MAQVICDLDIAAAMAVLSRIAKVGTTHIEKLREAVGMAAFAGERNVKLSATRLIYATPERGYKRTGTLRRGITAASPAYDHGGDEAAARSGEIGHAGGGGSALEVTRATGNAIESEVGCWLRYAPYVNNGTAHRQPTHFFEDGLSGLDAELERYVLVALTEIINEL